MITIGSVINGKYRLVRVLGDGGMGSVYEAQHAVLATRVAVKVLHPELVRRTGLVERFLQEARVSAQIRSPHVVQVHDVDRTPDGHAYIVMELLEGEPLSSVIERQRKLPVAVACDYTVQILEALEAAHALGVIHRDLKPENVFVTFVGGRPVLKLIDFGIAKAKRLDSQKSLTVAGVVMGTAEYMAPEQARSAESVDARADLYAVGVILYEMIAGARPVRGDTGEDARVIALKVERGEIVPLLQAAPETPRDLAGIVHHAMAARPEMRFSTATEFRLALEAAAAGKRPPTHVQGAAVGTVAMPGFVGAPAFARAAPAGSVADAAPSPPANANLPPEEPHVETVRAPPVATALAPAAYAGHDHPAADYPAGAAGAGPAASRRKGVSVVALVGLSLLLGVSVVGILVGTGTLALSSSPPEPPEPPETPAATVATATPGTVATVATAPSPTPTSTAVPTLVATPTSPAPAPPRPAPSPTVRPPAPGAVDAGTPRPFVFPSALPSTFPSFPLPLPAGFPSTLPSSFPTAFPSVFPGWPPLPGPTPSAAPKHAAPVEY